jgi:hypothetical protein
MNALKNALVFGGIVGLAVSVAPAATIPFSNDFSTTGFTAQSGFAASGGVYTYSVTGVGATVAYGTEQFSNLANSSFTASYQFNLSSIGANENAGDKTIGFGVFGSNATLGSPFLLADYTFDTSIP